MSAIDNSKHWRIGMLLGVPVYQLLEDNHSLVHRNPQDRHQIPKHLIGAVVPKGTIVVGGGSGEHPAIVLYDPSHCVARYLEFRLQTGQLKADPELKAACANMQGDLQTIEYCNWTNQNHLDFQKRCAWLSDRYKDRLTFEGWLMMSVGEFIFQAIPSFNQQIKVWHEKYASTAICWFGAVSIPYEPYGGNGRDRLKITDTESES